MSVPFPLTYGTDPATSTILLHPLHVPLICIWMQLKEARGVQVSLSYSFEGQASGA